MHSSYLAIAAIGGGIQVPNPFLSPGGLGGTEAITQKEMEMKMEAVKLVGDGMETAKLLESFTENGESLFASMGWEELPYGRKNECLEITFGLDGTHYRFQITKYISDADISYTVALQRVKREGGVTHSEKHTYNHH